MTPPPTIHPRHRPCRIAAVGALVAVGVLAYTRPAPAACIGDCGGDGQVTINELIVGVNIALGSQPVEACRAFDGDASGSVAISELILAINASLSGCPAEPSPSAPSTASSTAEATATLSATAGVSPPTPRATATPTPSGTSSATEAPSPTSSPTASATRIHSATPTRTPTTGSIVLPVGEGGGLDVRVFEAQDGTLYYVIGVDTDPNGVAIGAQITSLAMSDRNALSINEPFLGSDPVITSVSGASPGRLPALGRIRRTAILTGFTSNDIVLGDSNVDNGDFDPTLGGGSGRLILPGGDRAVSANRGLSTEQLFPVTQATGAGDEHVPGAIVKSVQRRRSPVTFQGDAIVFPYPPDGGCIGSDNSGDRCSDDGDCAVNCNQAGQGCCTQASQPPTCGGLFGESVVCDPNGNESLCALVGGNCADNPGGEAANQTVTFDDRTGSRVGNPESQTDGADGFFLHGRRDLIVFVVDPGDSRAINANASGFLLAGTCEDGSGPCATRFDCLSGSCGQDFTSRQVIGAVAGDSRTASTRRPRQSDAGLGGQISGQVFVSDNNTVYYVVAAVPGRSFGSQITSIMLTDGIVAEVSESLNEPPDPVLTSFSTVLSGGIACYPPLSAIKRTGIVTGLTSTFIEDMGNPLNGIWDPFANRGDGLLTLPGGTRTVAFDGSGTEPVASITESSGAGTTLVPAATVTQVTRRIGQQTLPDVPVIVFPYPPGPVVTSSGATCVDGFNPGAACDPANSGTADDNCLGGGTCTELGGEVAGQNVTLDSFVNRRIGNPASQDDQVDGFFLNNSTQLIVFMLRLCSPRFAANASGFAVTGSCSNAPTVPCTLDSDCSGGSCSDGLAARTVLRTTRAFQPLVDIQEFVSSTNKHYFVLRSDPRQFSVGVQITSVSLSTESVTTLTENPNNPPDPVATSISATRSPLSLGRIQRTGIVTGLVDNFIENMGNPVNGVFDPFANGGNGIITLPGGTLTVSFDGTGVVPVVNVVSSTGAGGTLVPAAASTDDLTRQLGLVAFDGLTSIVFPNPPGDIVTSSGATCQGGVHAGVACDPATANTVADSCTPGGICTNYGGETAGQNVTVDDTIGSRVGNRETQGSSIDGFFLRNSTQVIVFMVDGRIADDVFISASGFRVSGTCSNNADVPCGLNQECPGGTCGDGLTSRLVLEPEGASLGSFGLPTPTATPTVTPTITLTTIATT